MMMAMHASERAVCVSLYGGSDPAWQVPEGCGCAAEFASRDLTVQDVFEAVGKTTRTQHVRKPPSRYWNAWACPTAEGCLWWPVHPANTMACVSEAIALRC